MFRTVLMVLTVVLFGLMVYWVSQLAQLVGPRAAIVVLTIVVNAML